MQITSIQILNKINKEGLVNLLTPLLKTNRHALVNSHFASEPEIAIAAFDFVPPVVPEENLWR